jgi:alpha-galactosidase
MSWITDYYHKEHAINNPKLLQVVQDRLNELTGIIIEELQNLQNQATEKLFTLWKRKLYLYQPTRMAGGARL